jgi:hypothetical protein
MAAIDSDREIKDILFMVSLFLRSDEVPDAFGTL